MVYNERFDKIILFGGETEKLFSDETWVYDFNNNRWTKLELTNKPPGRTHHSMVYLDDWGLVFMFGGRGPAQYYNDYWIYDYNTNTWSDITNPAKTGPSPRKNAAMAYYDNYNTVVLFGGTDGSNSYFDDTWEYQYSGNTWSEINPIGGGPSARCANTMVGGSSFYGTLFYGGIGVDGISDETWIYEPDENRWYQRNPTINPGKMYGHSMVYIPIIQKAVLFGGQRAGFGGQSDETWAYTYSTNNWEKLEPSPKPTNRYYSAMAFDTESYVTVLFGGQRGDYRDVQTWIYRHGLNTWEHVIPKVKVKSWNIVLENLILGDFLLKRIPFFEKIQNL